MAWTERELKLKPLGRGFHLITEEVVRALPQLAGCRQGMLQLFLQHTSASLSINENASPDVRNDLAMVLDRLVPEDLAYQHTDEGSDDMPAHVKSALIGISLTIPVRAGRLSLGTWQGIYLGEHRNQAPARTILLTLMTPG